MIVGGSGGWDTGMVRRGKRNSSGASGSGCTYLDLVVPRGLPLIMYASRGGGGGQH